MKSIYLSAVLLLSCPVFAQKTKPKPQPAKPAAQKPSPAKPVPQNETKGQGQLQGVNGQFGVTYSLQNNFNFSILSARYTLEPFRSYNALNVKTDEKLLVLTVAMKNTLNVDNGFNPDSFFTFVDAHGNLYNSVDWVLQSKPEEGFYPNLRPGQGLGQPGTNDTVAAAVVIPAKERIVKIMINQGRLGRESEKVFRFYVAGATKAEAGENGDPKNTIAPLPAGAVDPSDPSGATPLDEGKGVLGQAFPSGQFFLRLDKTELIPGALGEKMPGDGKAFLVATVTARFAGKGSGSMFDLTGGDVPLHQVTDTDGEVYKPFGYLKASRNEEPEKEFKFGDELTFRIFFEVPRDLKLKKLVLGAGGARKWAFDSSVLK